MPLTTTLLLSGLLVPAFAGCEDEPDPPDAKIDAILQAKDRWQFAEAVEALLSSETPARLDELAAGENTSIALQAAWERVQRTVAPAADTKGRGKPDPRELSRFLGFAEGRLRLDIPQWWEDLLLGRMEWDDDRLDWKNSPYRLTDVGLARREIAVQKRADVVRLTVDGKALHLPPRMFAPDGIPSEGVDVLIADERAYLAIYARHSTPYPLVCVSSESGQPLWTAEVWVGNAISDYSGIGSHWASLAERNGSIYVFGWTAESMYIEAFEAKSGKNLLRFGTGYNRYWQKGR